MNNFEKVFVLDTNIILNNVKNIEALSQEGKNLIILPETVIDELDAKKSGFDEINFQAREFARFLYDATIDDQMEFDDLHIVRTSVGKIVINIVSKDTYQSDNEKINSIKNDRKILEIASDLKKLEIPNLKFISLDVMARTRALSLGIPTEPLNLGKQDVDADMEFHRTIEIPSFSGLSNDIPEQEDHITSLSIKDENGKEYIFYKTNGPYKWSTITEKNEHRLPAPPINKRQKIMAELILDQNDVVVVTGPAGTGKTLSALSAAMRLIDTQEMYKNIYYIRRTVISGSNEDELGFLPGTLEEKMVGYNQPMEDSIKKIIQLKRKRDQTKEELDEEIYKLKERYNVEYLYAGHLRGSTLDDGSIIICDETQNWDIASIRTIFSRVGKNSIIIAMGSNNQIDSKYLTRNTNALTFLMNKCGEENESDVKVKGVKLINVMRSKIAEWADIHLY